MHQTQHRPDSGQTKTLTKNTDIEQLGQGLCRTIICQASVIPLPSSHLLLIGFYGRWYLLPQRKALTRMLNHLTLHSSLGC